MKLIYGKIVASASLLTITPDKATPNGEWNQDRRVVVIDEAEFNAMAKKLENIVKIEKCEIDCPQCIHCHRKFSDCGIGSPIRPCQHFIARTKADAYLTMVVKLQKMIREGGLTEATDDWSDKMDGVWESLSEYEQEYVKKCQQES